MMYSQYILSCSLPELEIKGQCSGWGHEAKLWMGFNEQKERFHNNEI